MELCLTRFTLTLRRLRFRRWWPSASDASSWPCPRPRAATAARPASRRVLRRRARRARCFRAWPPPGPRRPDRPDGGQRGRERAGRLRLVRGPALSAAGPRCPAISSSRVRLRRSRRRPDQLRRRWTTWSPRPRHAACPCCPCSSTRPAGTASGSPAGRWRSRGTTPPYAAFCQPSSRRYGPGGTFWQPHAPAEPITGWQIWNEPNVPVFWPAASLRGALRRAAQGRPHGDQARRPARQDRAGRAGQLLLGGAAPDLSRARGPHAVRHRRPAPLHRDARRASSRSSRYGREVMRQYGDAAQADARRRDQLALVAGQDDPRHRL